MRDNNSNDRRVFARIDKTLAVRLLASGQDKESNAQTVDISANGMGIESETKLSPQTQLEMWLELPDKKGSFYTRGEVVWSSSFTDKLKQRVGVHLEKAELFGLSPVLWGTR
ncbi:MAG: PilZ domain-containing protein [Candidatus Omnitrophota bacterium]